MEPGFDLRLDAWRAVFGRPGHDEASRQLRSQVLELLRSEQDPFDATRSPHVGVCALVTTSDNTAVLLRRTGTDADWGLPTGHVLADDERAGMAALRAGRAALGDDRAGLSMLLLLRRVPAGEEPSEHLALGYHVSIPVAAPPTDPRFVWMEYGDAQAHVDAGLAAALDALRRSGTSRERNQISLRRTFGLREDLPWVREVLARADAGDPQITYSGGMARIPVHPDESEALARVAAAGDRLGEASVLLPEEARGGVWQDGHAFVFATTQEPDPALAEQMSTLLDVEVKVVQVEHAERELQRVARMVASDPVLSWSSCGADVVRSRVAVSTDRPEELQRLLAERYPDIAHMVEVEWVALDPRSLPRDPGEPPAPGTMTER